MDAVRFFFLALFVWGFMTFFLSQLFGCADDFDGFVGALVLFPSLFVTYFLVKLGKKKSPPTAVAHQ